VSSFNNVGFSLLNDNYTQVADRPGVLLLMCLYIIAGNTGLPVFLRTIFGTLGMLRPKNRAIRFVLDNPRCASCRVRDAILMSMSPLRVHAPG
jgi:Trk-type K+ transport system membrane component